MAAARPYEKIRSADLLSVSGRTERLLNSDTCRCTSDGSTDGLRVDSVEIYGHAMFAIAIFDGVVGLHKSIRRRSGDDSPRHDESRARQSLKKLSASGANSTGRFSSGRCAAHVIKFQQSQNQMVDFNVAGNGTG
jgi:hypothetical protein